MYWLLTQTYLLMAAAALLGLLLGWSLRGATLLGRYRAARVEREVARTEAQQLQSELDQLYAARAGDEETAKKAQRLEAALSDRDRRIETLEAAAAQHETVRNRATFLERNTKELQDKIAELSGAAGAAAATPAQSEEAGAGKAAGDGQAAWRGRYLDQRVAALEHDLVEARTALEAARQAAETTPTEAPAPDDTADEGAANGRSAEEEMAQLRWRNRYLEGRLAYYADGPADAEGEDAAEDSAQEARVEPEPQPESDPVPAGAAAAAAALSVIERLAPPAPDVTAVKPAVFDTPENGQADDLTRIDGVGPKLQAVLNTLGIYHLGQIANWSEGNAAWVEEELNLPGRARRERWSEQARELAAAAETAA